MKILIAGASGFLGTALKVRFAERGYEVRRLVRRTPVTSSTEFHWDPSIGRINADAVTGVDVIINLAGPPVFTRPWTDSRRELLRTARIESTRLLAETVVERYADSLDKPLWLQSSATGWYGTRSGPTPYDESAPAAGDFLGQLAKDWEAATDQASSAGVPVIFLRNGMVLDRSGSTLKLIKPVFAAGLGARIGTGDQHMPMISLHDWLRVVEFMITERPAEGPYKRHHPRPADQRRIHHHPGRPARPQGSVGGAERRAAHRPGRTGRATRRRSVRRPEGAAGRRLRLRRPGRGQHAAAGPERSLTGR